MKTTLEIPDDLYRELKMRSARDGVTVTHLVKEALGRLLVRSVASDEEREPTGKWSKDLAAWRKKEASFLKSMRGRVFGASAVEDLLGGRK